ncbi:unnamed protein product, partial [Oppiella nova]
ISNDANKLDLLKPTPSEQAWNHTGQITWVVLASGANTWDRYADQANVYHAYQMIHAHGIPDENIIVFHYDDLADNPSNPYPGTVINLPGGPDVYKGVPKTYTKTDVTPENFLAALRGDEKLEKSGKKVVKSGPNDRIFVFLNGAHSGEQTVMFPNGVLHAQDLNNVLIDMHKQNRFKGMTFYLDSSYSGSMFDKLLPNNSNIYAVTTSRPDQLTYLCYNDSKWGTYLATEFANAWLNDSDHSDLSKELLSEQFEFIHKYQVYEVAMQYGDLSIVNETVGTYMGNKKVPSQTSIQTACKSVPVPEAPVYRLQRLITSTNNIELKQKYVTELEGLLSRRKLMDKQIEEYVNELPAIDANITLNGKLELNNRDCYKQLVNTFYHKCYNLSKNTYGIQKLQTFVNICEQMRDSSDADIAVNRLIQYCDRNVYYN